VEIVDSFGSLDEEGKLQFVSERKLGDEGVEISSFHKFQHQPHFFIVEDTPSVDLADVLESECCHCFQFVANIHNCLFVLCSNLIVGVSVVCCAVGVGVGWGGGGGCCVCVVCGAWCECGVVFCVVITIFIATVELPPLPFHTPLNTVPNVPPPRCSPISKSFGGICKCFYLWGKTYIIIKHEIY
jgi:hypothetical protein